MTASADEKAQAKKIHQNLSGAVEYAPWWARILSALCLGVGTVLGYQRIAIRSASALGEPI